MQKGRLITAYFSPVGSTLRVIKHIGSLIGNADLEIDFTVKRNEDSLNIELNPDDILVIGVPVYAGRVPQPAADRMSRLKGNGAAAVIIATYGNRHYDDALIEMKTILESCGFNVTGCMAVVTEHSLVRSIAKGRPDMHDIIKIEELAGRISKKIKNGPAEGISVSVPGNIEYRPYHKIPFVPHVSGKCSSCGVCARECPVGAIDMNNPRLTDKNTCISCMRCIAICPGESRKLHFYERFMAKRSIIKKCTERREPELFI